MWREKRKHQKKRSRTPWAMGVTTDRQAEETEASLIFYLPSRLSVTNSIGQPDTAVVLAKKRVKRTKQRTLEGGFISPSDRRGPAGDTPPRRREHRVARVVRRAPLVDRRLPQHARRHQAREPRT